MSLLDLITGGKSSEASSDYEKALQALQGVKTPTADEMKYQVQQLVQAGVLTPEQAQTFLQSPNALASENIDQTGTQAQQKSIGELLAAAQRGGMSPADEAAMGQITQGLNTQEKGANDAVLQNQAARGALTGGETMAAQLANNQNATVNANQLGLGTAGQAYQNRLNELTTAGGLGAGLQGQQNTQANTVAAATNAINQFNTAQQQQQENYNVGNRNAAQSYNLENKQNIGNENVRNANEYSRYQAQLPEEVFQNQMQKATGVAGGYQNAAQNATQQGGQQASLIGGVIGTGGQVAAGALAPAPIALASEGGEIHEYLGGGRVEADRPGERAQFPGNSPKNDKIPAYLSEGEVVLPRSVAQHPQPDQVMAFLNRMRKPKPVHPDDAATLLHALGRVREMPHAV